MGTLRGHSKDVYCVAVFPDGSKVITGSVDGTAKIWDANTGDTISTLRGYNLRVYCVAVFPDGQRVITGSYHMVQIWDANTGDIISTLIEAIRGVAVFPDPDNLQ